MVTLARPGLSTLMLTRGVMRVSRETPEPAEAKLLKVIGNAQFQELEGAHAFEALTWGHASKSTALACVRDGEVWTQLVPAAPASGPDGLFNVFSFHFRGELDASGFVGWLASHHLKRTVGTGGDLWERSPWRGSTQCLAKEARILAETQKRPPVPRTHWSSRRMATRHGVSQSFVARLIATVENR